MREPVQTPTAVAVAVSLIVTEVAAIDEALAWDASWRDLGLDSLDIIEVVERCEQELGVRIPDAALLRMRTTGDLLRYLDV